MYNVSWNSFSEHLASYQRLLYEEGMFADVTLVTDDKRTFKAHKTVLSGASDMFTELLSLDTSAQPMLFIRGVSHKEMEALLKFIYLGECQLPDNELDHFTQTGLELGVRELIHIGLKNEEEPEQAVPINENRGITKKINISTELFFNKDNHLVNNRQKILNSCFQNSQIEVKRGYPENINTQLKLKKQDTPIEKSGIKPREKQDSSSSDDILENLDLVHFSAIVEEHENKLRRKRRSRKDIKDVKELVGQQTFCHLCKTDFGDPPSYKEHRLSIHPMDDVFCSLCDEKFEKVFLLHNHRVEKHRQNDETIVCYCSSKCKNAKQYRNHFRSHKESGFKCPKCNMNKPYVGRFQHFKKCDGTPVGEEVMVKKKEKVKDDDKIRLKCNFCDKHKIGNKQLQIHVSRTHPKCLVPNCDFIVTGKRREKRHAQIQLNRHMRREHPETLKVEKPKEKIHTCPHCNFESGLKSNLARHLKSSCKQVQPQLMISF